MRIVRLLTFRRKATGETEPLKVLAKLRELKNSF